MEELEGILMQEDLELLEQLWPASSTMVDDASLNLNQFWGMEFLDVGSFESELGDVFFIPQEDPPSCFTNTEQENTNLYDQYIAREPEQEQEEEREQQHVVQPLRPLDKDEEEEEEEEEVETDDKSSRPDSKNLVSERNRRNRLNRQLFTLRSLVPNITKMDKRSILVDALAYLQGITQQIELEIEKSSLSSDSLASSSISSCNEGLMQDEVQPVQTTLYEQQCTDLPALSLMEADVLDEERLLLRIYCNKAVGALGHVYRTIEMLGLEITCITSSQFDQETLQTTAFLRAKKKGVMSQEKLLDRVTLNAKQLGLLLPPGKND